MPLAQSVCYKRSAYDEYRRRHLSLIEVLKDTCAGMFATAISFYEYRMPLRFTARVSLICEV